MRQIFTILLLLLVFVTNSQITSISTYGFNPTGTYDTIKSILLVTQCDSCIAMSIEGYTTRRKWVYYGDPMPVQGLTGQYDDMWKVIEHLDNKKKKLKDYIYIWDYFLYTDKKKK